MPIKKTLLALTLLLVAAFAVWYALRYFSAPPERDHLGEYRALEEQLGTPAAHNAAAWSVYTALIERVEAMEEAAATAFRIRDVDMRDAGVTPERAAAEDIDEADRLAAVSAFNAYTDSDVPELLTAVLADPTLGAPRFSRDGPPSFATELDPGITGTRTLASAEAARLDRALRSGDDATALECYANLLAMRRIVEQQPMLITMLIGQSVSWVAQEPLRAALHEERVSPQLAQGLVDLIAEFHVTERDRTDALYRGEAVSIDRTLQMLYEGELDGDWVGGMPPRFLWASRKEVAGLLNGYMESGRLYLLDGPRNAAPMDFESDLYSWSIVDRFGRAPLERMLPATSSAAIVVHTARAQRAMLLVAAAIVVYEGRSGAPPRTLDELVAEGVLEELPRDPFASDGRLRYRADPDAPLGYVLYSVGWDDTDDGGAFDPEAPLPNNLSRMDEGEDALWTPAPEREAP